MPRYLQIEDYNLVNAEHQTQNIYLSKYHTCSIILYTKESTSTDNYDQIHICNQYNFVTYIFNDSDNIHFFFKIIQVRHSLPTITLHILSLNNKRFMKHTL